MLTIDTLLTARYIIPVEPAGAVLAGHAIAVDNGKILAVLPAATAHQHYLPREHIALPDHVLIPGLVNLHTHAAMSLMRGLADDLPLMAWLKSHIWPAEAEHAQHEFAFHGTQLACAEMLQGGITCFNDMYFFPEAAAHAVQAAGMRAALGMIVLDAPTAYASDADDYLAKGVALRDEYRDHPLLSFCLAPHAPYTVGDKTFTKIVTYAEQLNLPVHLHLHETLDEITDSLQQHNLRPIARLNHLGLLGPNLIAVHATHLNDAEIALLSQQGCHVAHCPSSNLKLASGIAPVSAMAQRGINAGLGTDGAASNNRLDLFAEMRLAALLAKAQSGQADALPAAQVLQMATLNGAQALGLDRLIGSLVAGKAADITAVDFSGLALLPCYDPLSHLVYVAGRENVSHVWVNGKLLLDNRRLTTLDEVTLKNQTVVWQQKLGAHHV